MGQPVADPPVQYAQPISGMQVLDLAIGTREPAITLAQRMGPSRHVTAVDLSADFLEVAQKRAQDCGFTNFTTQQADAHSLPFPDDSFDLATSRVCRNVLPRSAASIARTAARAALVCEGVLSCVGVFRAPFWQSMMGVVHWVGWRDVTRAGRAESFPILRIAFGATVDLASGRK